MNTIVVYSMLSEILTREPDETTVRRRTLGAHCRLAEANVEGNIR